MAEQNSNSPPSGGVDPISGFWRDMWARAAAGGGMPGGMPGMAGIPGMPGMGQAMGQAMGTCGDASLGGAFMSPEALRRMQGAFYESMAQYAEQYMRSPEFLTAMKRSMDQAMQLRQQMDDFLKSNMATAFESATGGSNSEILGAIRQTSAQLQAQIAKLDARLSDVESAVTGKPKPPASKPAAKTPTKPNKR